MSPPIDRDMPPPAEGPDPNLDPIGFLRSRGVQFVEPVPPTPAPEPPPPRNLGEALVAAAKEAMARGEKLPRALGIR